MEDTSVNVVDVSAVRKRIEIEIPAARVQAEWDRGMAIVGQQARLPGFRPGKVPRAVLERTYGDHVRRDVLSRLVEGSFRDALQRLALPIVGSPDIDADVPVVGQPFRYSAVVDVRPEIAVDGIGELQVERPSTDVVEADVDRVLESMRERAAQLAPLERATIVAGDVVTVNITTHAPEGEPQTREDIHLDAGGGSFPQALERQLVGHERGERTTFEVPYPEDHASPAVAGKTIRFDVEIVDVREKQLPALDDDFARDHGRCDTLDALRMRVREDLERQATERADQAVRRGLLDQLVQRTTFEVPPSLVAGRVDAMMEQLQLQVPPGAAQSDAVTRVREQLAPGAERDVRAELILDALATRDGVEVDEAELDGEVEAAAQRHAESSDEIRRLYQRPEARAALRARLRRERALDALRGSARIVPLPPSQVIAPEIQSR